MKNRFLALLICAILVFSIIPFGKNIKASQTNNNAKQVNTPEQMAAVMREKANNNTARMKGKITQSQVNETIKQKLIVKTRDEIENTYGANSVYYYTVGNYQILFYDTADEAKNACEKLKKDLPGTTIFQDIPITLKEAAKDNGSDEVAAYDGIKKMGMDQLKEEKDSWKNKSAKVAVIDSGINVDHQWFKNRLDRENSINLALDEGNEDDKTKPAYNDTKQGHGSHVAGIITQATPEEVQVMAIRVFSALGTASYATITNAVDYAVEHKADIINMSLGFEIIMQSYNEKAGEKVAFLQIKNYCIETFENGQAAMSDGAYQHVALDVEDIESMYQKICNEKHTVITDGIEELPFWEKGVKFFMIKGPNEERIEFCQKL